MTVLFPPLTPYRTGQLVVDGLHSIYFEESGNPKGTPVLFLHGGPGAGLSAYYRRLFDPSAWRIIGFDQRGCGRSTPFAEVTANSPAHLISDIEHLRLHLGVERWHVNGGSWGTTLALAYAISHPERILGMILRGIFLMRQDEIHWFMHGLKTMRPEAWEKFTRLIPADKRGGGDLLDTYLDLLQNPEPTVHAEAARRWYHYENSCSTLLENTAAPMNSDDDRTALSLARLEAYYFKHHRFQPDDWLLREAHRYRGIPAVIVQGQYDLICPPTSAHALHQVWPEAAYVLVPDAGHSVTESGITAAILTATERMKGMR